MGWEAGSAATKQRYTNLCTVSLGGHCNVDIDECHSKPCMNGGLCTDSNTDDAIQINAFTCSCVVGFQGVRCEVDVNECTSNPCQNSASCRDSSATGLPRVPVDSYQCCVGSPCAVDVCSSVFACACSPGFSGKSCEVDERVDECTSNPCQNGASCSDSSSAGLRNGLDWNDSYQCTCAAGYTNGWCEYNYIDKISIQCSESSGNCDVEVDECDSDPCLNGATCASSGLYFSCTCVAGYANGICSAIHMYEYVQQCGEAAATSTGVCDIDMDECSSTPCQSGGTCTTTATPDTYTCTCVDGWTGHDCEVDIDECETEQSACITAHGSVCTDSSVVQRTPPHQGRFWQIRSMGPSLGGVQRTWAWCVSAA